jgi:formamidopyrimidine-DNA glycosylase
MLGEIELVDRPEDYTKENLIGPDAYSLSKDEFYEKILTKKGMIKTALMDQSLISGIGNVYSDEILFHAKIHPKRKASDLRKKDIDHIYDKMQYVFQGAIEGNVEEFPGDFLIPRREEGLACPKCGGDIKKQKVGGRSAYICSKCQCL